MGVVWKAHDTTLGRDVAIKVLPELFASDPERLARFEREARLLAALNHSRIAAVYGFHAEAGMRFLAMELAEGESLAARLARGALPVEDAVAIARQLADALEAAHERGIVHRDLKPGNIMLAPDGGVKVLDFGLAKALEGDRAVESSSNLTHSPTITHAMTSANVILGTAAYMSPEQARGHAADKRADVWAFGVILFEMLTGRQLFSGETVSDTLAAVLRAEPDWNALPKETPSRIRRLLERCRTRDARQRLRDIGEARILLDGAAPEPPIAAAAAPVSRTSPWRPLAFVVGGLVIGALAAMGFSRVGSRPADAPVRRFVIAGLDSAGVAPDLPVIAPDGRAVAYVMGTTLWVRALDALEPRALATTNGLTAPFWSPDGRHVGYIVGSRLMKVPVSGGDPQLISDLRQPFTGGAGAWWRDDDVIVCSRAEADGLMEVPARGGDPRTLLLPDTTAEGDLHQPSVLPGGRGVLYVVHRKQGGDTIELLSRGKRTVVLRLEGQTLESPVWSPTGHIVFRRSPQNSGVWALPFSLGRLEPTGEPFLVASNAILPSVADDGTLVLRAGSRSRIRQLTWIDRAGNVLGTVGDPEEGLDVITGPAIAPDGVRIAIGQSVGTEESDLWIFDSARGTKTRLTFEPGIEDDPAWTPDGARIVYSAGTTGCTSVACLSILVRSADGTGAPDTVGSGALPHVAPDGGSVGHCAMGGRSTDLAVTSLVSRGQSALVVSEDDIQISPRVSPDGRLLAYVSMVSGKPEIYLRRFPSGTGKWQVSTGGGSSPQWNGAGDRLYYAHEDDYYELEVGRGETPALGVPRKLFTLRPSARAFRAQTASFAVSRDGQRFLVVRPIGAAGQGAHVLAVQNWLSEFDAEQ